MPIRKTCIFDYYATGLSMRPGDKEHFCDKTLNCAKVKGKVQTSPSSAGFCLPGSPSQAGSKPGDSLFRSNLLACGLSGPRGFKSPSRRHFLHAHLNLFEKELHFAFGNRACFVENDYNLSLRVFT
jgi:hypothetical protein